MMTRVVLENPLDNQPANNGIYQLPTPDKCFRRERRRAIYEVEDIKSLKIYRKQPSTFLNFTFHDIDNDSLLF